MKLIAQRVFDVNNLPATNLPHAVFAVTASDNQHLFLKYDQIELRQTEEEIQWKPIGEDQDAWLLLFTIAQVATNSADRLDFRVQGDFLQWQVKGDVSWNNLYSIANLNQSVVDAQAAAAAAEADAIATAADRVQTGLDVVATAADAVQTDLDRTAAANSATAADASKTQSQAWAESATAPGDPGTQSSKSWAEDAQSLVTDLETFRTTLSATVNTLSPGEAATVVYNDLDPSLTFSLPAGHDAWNPTFALVTDGDRRVQQVVDWFGGTGTKPTVGQYIGPTGFVTVIGDAVDIRGQIGQPGDEFGAYVFNDDGSAVNQGGYVIMRSAATSYEFRRVYAEVINGTGTIDIVVLVNNIAVHTVTVDETAPVEEAVVIDMAPRDSLSFDFVTTVGTPSGVWIQLDRGIS